MTRAENIADVSARLYSHLGANRDNYNNVYSYTTLLTADEAVKRATYLADALEKNKLAPWVMGDQ